MKKIFLLFSLVLLFNVTFSQAFMSDILLEKLEKNNNKGNLTEVILVFKKQVNLDSLYINFKKNNTPVDKRAKIVIKELQKQANKSQKEIIDIIKTQKKLNSKTIANYQSFWVTNIISLTASSDFIYDISNSKDLEYIKINERKFISPKVEVSKSTNETNSLAEKGVIAINARKMWALGYTGKNRIAYGVDTGVFYKHPSIKDNFLGNNLPISQCWYSFNHNPKPYDISSHGTHTMGTILGLNEQDGDTIGVAFNAKWIASDPIVSDIADLRTLSEIIYSFEWALNPDNDTSTVSDIPDAVNNSWGNIYPPDIVQCNSLESMTIDALATAGVAIIFSAGNDGPGVGTVGEPALISKNLVNVFSVGAVNANVDSLPIANFSSRGPTICDTLSSLAIKPEVSAPGYQVLSASHDFGYESFSGTSMASPHVTGAVLLLKEAFPYLVGEEILLALYNSAVDLGVPGEDNIYGMGMIDVFAAYNLLSATYTPVQPKSDYDISTKDVIINSTEFCDSLINVKIVLSNNGDSTIFGYTLKYYVNGLATSLVYNDTLTSNSLDTININNFELNSGYNSLKFNVSIDSSEFDIYNNKLFKEINTTKIHNIPYINDFENDNFDFNNSDWFFQDPDYDISWSVDSTAGLQNSYKSAKFKFYKYSPFIGQHDYLISPKIIIPDTGNLTLRFALSYRKYSLFNNDTLQIHVSTDCGETFQYLIYQKHKDNLATVTPHSNIKFIPNSNSDWRTETIDLSQFVGEGSIIVRFTTINDYGNNLYIDNFRIYSDNDPLLIKKENISNNISIYPNPANDILNITNITSNNFAITIYDISGKEVYKKHYKNSSQTIKINLNKLNNGMFIVKYEDINNSKYIKFSKIN